MTEKTTPLDPATCLALKPIHDIGNQAIKERDEWNRWSVGIARMLNVSCSNFRTDIVAEQYAELRDRITQALNTHSALIDGWQNKWECAVEMAAQAEAKLELLTAALNLSPNSTDHPTN
jgi:hypothetical protein